MKVMVYSTISSEEKGHSNSLTPEGAREELDRKYNRNEAVDKCVLASFGSAWATMKVNSYSYSSKMRTARLLTVCLLGGVHQSSGVLFHPWEGG